MQQKEITHEPDVHHAFSEPTGSGGPIPTEAPQSGKRILLSIFLYMILLPTVIMMLARLLIE